MSGYPVAGYQGRGAMRLLFGAWAAVVCVLSLLPAVATPPTFGISDVVLHMGMYGVGGLCAGLGWRRARPLAFALAAAALLGGGLELAQASAIPGRSGEWHDLAANLGGLVIGVVLTRFGPAAGRND